MRAGARWALLGLVAVAGCADQTQLLIEIDSPVAVPEELDQIEIVAVGLHSTSRLERTIGRQTPLPHSYSLLPGPSGPEPVLVTVTGRKTNADEDTPVFVVRRVVETAFRQGGTVYLSLTMPRACVGVVCADGVDCVDGRCFTGKQPNDVPP